MSSKIFCKKINKLLKKMEKPPFPGILGKRIFNCISEQAWIEWTFMQIKIINEYKLNLFNSKHRYILIKQMKKFLNLDI